MLLPVAGLLPRPSPVLPPAFAPGPAVCPGAPAAAREQGAEEEQEEEEEEEEEEAGGARAPFPGVEAPCAARAEAKLLAALLLLLLLLPVALAAPLLFPFAAARLARSQASQRATSLS